MLKLNRFGSGKKCYSTVSTVVNAGVNHGKARQAPGVVRPKNQDDQSSEFVSLVTSKYANKLNYLNAVLDKADNHRKAVYEKIVAERKPIIDILEKQYCVPGRSTLLQVGSSATGLTFDHGADIDLCFFTEDEQFYQDIHRNSDFRHYFFEQLRLRTEELYKIDPRLKVNATTSFINATVPILIVNFGMNLMMDIQVPLHDFQAIRNTNLVKHYVMADKRFPKVYLYIKKLFEALGLRNSKGGLLSSYHLTMLTVHFLQCRTMPNPVLPVLCSTHPHLVAPNLPIKKVIQLLNGSIPTVEQFDWKSKNKKSAAQLAVEMIDYYKNFDVHGTSIMISRGVALKRKVLNSDHPSLRLNDPYSKMSICRSVHIPDAFQTAINFIYRKMKAGMLIDSYPHFEDTKYFRGDAEFKPWFHMLKCID